MKALARASVTDWLLLEREGSRRKALYALVVAGEFVADVDSHPVRYLQGREVRRLLYVRLEDLPLVSNCFS